MNRFAVTRPASLEQAPAMLSGNRFSLEPGSYRLTVSKQGFRSHSETITIGPGQSSLKRLVSLEPES